MKIKRPLSIFFITVLVLAGVTALVPYALSYLSNTQEKGISIRTTPASQLWEIQGEFNEAQWKKDNKSGLSIKNISPRDLVIYFEFTGDLKQIFKHSDPVMVPSESDADLLFYPLDDEDSLRLLNPLDLIDIHQDSKNEKSITTLTWKDFSGEVVIHTLNYYAKLESGEINISGRTLWDMFFSRKYQEGPKIYYENIWKVEQVSQKETNKEEKLDAETNQKISQSGYNEVIFSNEETSSYLKELEKFEGIEILQPVADIINNIAPGFMDEHTYLYKKFTQLQNQVKKLLYTIEVLQEDNQKLKGTISNLYDRITSLEQVNEALSGQLQEKRNSHSSKTDVANEEASQGTEETADENLQIDIDNENNVSDLEDSAQTGHSGENVVQEPEDNSAVAPANDL